MLDVAIVVRLVRRFPVQSVKKDSIRDVSATRDATTVKRVFVRVAANMFAISVNMMRRSVLDVFNIIPVIFVDRSWWSV